MNKAYKYTLTANECKEITFDVGVNRLAISNANGTDGDTTIVTSEITKTDSGDICSFVDGADAPFADFIVNIVAQQSGSGDPSPTNVRPISGWTGANVYVSGEDTSDQTTYNVNWQSTADTVYGGTLDVKTGVLTRTYSLYDLGSINYSKSAANVFYSTINLKKDGSSKMVCSCYKYSANKAYNVEDMCISDSNNSSYLKRIFIYDSSQSEKTPEEFKSALAGQSLLFIRDTPVTYQLTPVEIRSLLGVNNVWADCGAVNVRYFVQSTQPMIDYIDDKTPVFFDAVEDLSTYDVSLVGATSTDIKNYLLANKNANIVIRVKRYSTILLYYLREYSPNYFAEFATHAIIFDAEGTKSMRINYLRLDLTQETSDFTDDYIILPTT